VCCDEILGFEQTLRLIVYMDTWIYLRIFQHDMFYGQDNIKAIQKRQHQGKKKLKLFGH
jgi:hypothetical protein